MSAETSLARRDPAAVPVRVVVAEDDTDIRALVQIVLEQMDLEVVAVGDGHEALTQVRRAPTQLLLLDIEMPGLDGLAVCREVRADPNLADLPIMFTTARAQSGDVQAGMDAGGDTYIIKPFGPIELREHVEHVLRHGRGPWGSNATH